jgi:hypothetical protein
VCVCVCDILSKGCVCGVWCSLRELSDGDRTEIRNVSSMEVKDCTHKHKRAHTIVEREK